MSPAIPVTHANNAENVKSVDCGSTVTFRCQAPVKLSRIELNQFQRLLIEEIGAASAGVDVEMLTETASRGTTDTGSTALGRPKVIPKIFTSFLEPQFWRHRRER